MADVPFDIGHLHQGEQDRIRDGQLTRDERDNLMRGENPWPKPVRKGLADIAKQIEQEAAKGRPDFTPLIDSFKKQDDETKRALNKLVYGDADESDPIDWTSTKQKRKTSTDDD